MSRDLTKLTHVITLMDTAWEEMFMVVLDVLEAGMDCNVMLVLTASVLRLVASVRIAREVGRICFCLWLSLLYVLV